MKIRSLLLSLALLLAAPFALAQDAVDEAPEVSDFLKAPEVVPSPVSAEGIEPDITIREEGRQTIYEYRIKGQLYMVRVQPQIGPPYYLLDTDGDGIMDVQNDSPRDIAVPQWVIFSWD
jgi:hypothetical protein